MQLSRQAFELIARVLRETDGDTHHGIAQAFADELAATNPRFQRERFLRACESREEER